MSLARPAAAKAAEQYQGRATFVQRDAHQLGRSVVAGTPEQLLAACSGLAAVVGSALVRTDCSGCTSRRIPEDLDTHAVSAWLRNVPLVHFTFYQVE